MVLQERLSAAADPMKVMSSCRPTLVISLGASSSDLERANSSPSTNITCMARDPCHPHLVVPSTVQPSSHHCQNLVSQGSHWAAQIAASCGHAVLAASKQVERKALPWELSRSIGSTTSASCSSLGRSPPCHSPSLAQCAQTVPPHLACQTPGLWVPLLLRSLSMCCSITQLSATFIGTSANAIGRSFRGHGCGNCYPGSGFLGPQSSGAVDAAVHSSAVWCDTTACVHVPIHSRSTAGPPSERPMAAMSAFCQPLGLGRQHNTPGHDPARRHTSPPASPSPFHNSGSYSVSVTAVRGAL